MLLIIHLYLNYAAVRSVSMRTLNRQRANLLFSHILAFDKVLTPKQVSLSERIFEKDGVLRWAGGQFLGTARIGVGIRDLLCNNPSVQETSAAGKETTRQSMPYLIDVVQVFEAERYMMDYKIERVPAFNIALKTDSTALDQLKAWFHAIILAKDIFDSEHASSGQTKQLRSDESKQAAISRTLKRANELFEEHSGRIRAAGWSMDVAALETFSGPRIVQQR